jgi:hypothetical protein
MKNGSMVRKDAAAFIHADTPVVAGNEVQRTTVLQRRLTDEALQCRNTVMAVLFPSELTKTVRNIEQEIVIERLRTDQEAASYLNEAGLTLLRTALDQVVKCGVADSEAATASSLLARRVRLEEELTSMWERFVESAVAERKWAASLPPDFRKLAEQKVLDSYIGCYEMMKTMLRNFEAIAKQNIGRQ